MKFIFVSYSNIGTNHTDKNDIIYHKPVSVTAYNRYGIAVTR